MCNFVQCEGETATFDLAKNYQNLRMTKLQPIHHRVFGFKLQILHQQFYYYYNSPKGYFYILDSVR